MIIKPVRVIVVAVACCMAFSAQLCAEANSKNFAFDGIRIAVLIDGRSQLYFRGNTAKWFHLDFTAPGRHDGANAATIINGVPWFPVWPDVPDANNINCNCFSDVFEGVVPGVPETTGYFKLVGVQVRESASVIQNPTAENDYTLIIEFNDNLHVGSSNYVLDLIETEPDMPGIHQIKQQAYLKASNTEFENHFGETVAISGNTLVVGAPKEESSATGINGDQGDNSAPDAGAAYVFTRDGALWSQQAYLKASNSEPGDSFGDAVAIFSDTLVVGAPFKGNADTTTTGVNGDKGNNATEDSGAAYVFARSGSIWLEQAYLEASNSEPGDLFGSAVAISGDTIVVGAVDEQSNATGVNGNQDDNSLGHSGAAYVYTRSGPAWVEQAYLKASNTRADTHFGSSVAISGDTLVVGGGGAYVFTRTGTNWSQQAHLIAIDSEASDSFGGEFGTTSVAISGDTVVVGAKREESAATGINGSSADNSASGAGAAYVFTRSGTEWTQQAYLKASNTDMADDFGHSVSVSGDSIAIGARFERGSAKGINGDQEDNLTFRAGAVYTFTRTGSVWSQQAYIKASNTDPNDGFGSSVGLSGGTLLVGAVHESSNAAGINGIQVDNSVVGAGAAYVFTALQGFAINPGLNGSWANFDTLGQGFFIDVLPNIPLVFLAWFTWETDRVVAAQNDSPFQQLSKTSGNKVMAVVGNENHRWVTAQGSYAGNTAELDVTITRGGLFDNPQPVTNSEPGTQGTITLTFDDCKTGTVDYEFTAYGLTGSVPIQRLSEDNVEMCNSLNAAAQAAQ